MSINGPGRLQIAIQSPDGRREAALPAMSVTSCPYRRETVAVANVIRIQEPSDRRCAVDVHDDEVRVPTMSAIPTSGGQREATRG